VISRALAESQLSTLAGEDIELPQTADVHSGPSTCPACGSNDVMWGCAPEQTRTREEVHPVAWHETEWMADTFICRACWAGWIEPDEAEPIAWVRPYWRE
jgi:hypothetical protein